MTHTPDLTIARRNELIIFDNYKLWGLFFEAVIFEFYYWQQISSFVERFTCRVLMDFHSASFTDFLSDLKPWSFLFVCSFASFFGPLFSLGCAFFQKGNPCKA